MKPETILRSDVLDILFENRNKSYGAYTLRKYYHYHLYAALCAMFVLITLLWIFGTGKKSREIILSVPVCLFDDTIKLNIIDPPPPQQPLPAISRALNTSVVKSVTPVIVRENIETEMPDNTKLDASIIGLQNKDGDLTGVGDGPTNSGIETNLPNSAIEPTRIEESEILGSAAIMPEFPGGKNALYRWLSKELRPQDGLEPGQRFRVVVRFAVDVNGVISQVHILQNGGDLFDKEVMRVINKMPKWTPGKQNGKPVAVWFNLPVIFEMPEL